MENLEQLVESPKHGCTLFYCSKRRELHRAGFLLASHADVLRGSSRVPAPRGAGTRDEPIRTSAWEARFLPNSLFFSLTVDYE